MPVKTYKRIYVWQRAIRFFHWTNALCIVILILTGYIIGNPPAIQSGGEAYQSYWFGIVRFTHFATAYILVFNFIYRIYFFFFGNKWARWDQFIPTSRRFIQELFYVIRVDILHLKGEERVAIGHNPLAGFSYLFMFIFMIVTILTGFGLYAEMSGWWFAKLFTWVPAVFGEEFTIRQIHHIMMWVFIVFSMIHIHLVVFHDYVEARGEASSIVSGFKFILKERYDKERGVVEEKDSVEEQVRM